ncbi:programmed cell death 1 ligand 1 isoform X2 [Thalassophryne amazonica]|uniref:programmed cell death 1 ligand 1 isoform X2 n=1 Tax=Thalassophryne amazonica TaxID=390379 RepID=UPI0014713B33|nr:programmed cell death 1 ligand 1 isoform X2 [Thalassophryne amazonica]
MNCQMDWTLLLILPVMFQPSFSVLFTVETEQNTYTSTIRGDVVMGCRFKPIPSNPYSGLKVTWHWITSTVTREVYQLDNGVENLASQYPDYRGRVKLLSKLLKEGWAKLQVSMLRINDSGVYQCLVQTEEGADYKTVVLSVEAPYKKVSKSVQKATQEDEVVLTCQSDGYPRTAVEWMDEHLQRINSNTTAVPTPDQLYKVTSQIKVTTLKQNSYTCNFTKDGLSATFHIPDDIPTLHTRNGTVITVICTVVVLLAVMFVVLMHRWQKGIQMKTENEEEKMISNEDHTKETLEVFLKDHYTNLLFNKDEKQYWDAFCVEVLPERLKNNDGHPVEFHSLLPEAGETVLLEGAPGSGKTTVVQILLYSWTTGLSHASSNVPDFTNLRLIFCLDCSKVKTDLFQEVKTQLCLSESTVDRLRMVLLNGSDDALLLLDGYKEGNQLFDMSLRKFLSERAGCRVLVLACPHNCPKLKDAVGPIRMLKLHI